LRLPLDSLPKLQNKREIVVDRSLFEDLPALDDYDEKVKKRYGTISKLFQAAKRVLSKKEEKQKRTRKKTKPYLKLIHLLRQCVSRNVMECCMFFYRQQII
jgi:hypothetical protein